REMGTDRPNILIYVTDDSDPRLYPPLSPFLTEAELRVSADGKRALPLPRMDWIRDFFNNSLVFPRALNECSVCGSSRCASGTGLKPCQFGMRAQDLTPETRKLLEEVHGLPFTSIKYANTQVAPYLLFPRLVKSAGYETFGAGKLRLSSKELPYGELFDVFHD